MEILINILPEEKKRSYRESRRFRLVMKQGFIAVAILAFYVSILGSIYYTLSTQFNGLQEVDLMERQKAVFQEIDSNNRVIKETNMSVSNVSKFQKEHIIWSDVLTKLTSTLPDTITLSTLSTHDLTISLAGKSATRESLLAFQDKLKQSDCFQNPQLPLSDLFSQIDVDFQMDVEVKLSCLKPQTL